MRILNQYKESDLIFFDIETAKAEKKLTPGTPLYDAWKYKTRYQNEFAEKLSRSGTNVEVSLQEFFDEKSALYAPFGRIVCIVAGRIEGDNLKVKAYTGEGDEKKLLEEFNNDLSKWTIARPNAVLAGFNSVGFDAPFIFKRMVVHGITAHDLIDSGGLKPWEVKALDLSQVWKGLSFYPDSLIAVAAALGLPSPKGAMDGSEVSEAFYAGKINEIAAYCKLDVLTTANIYRRFVQKSLVKFAE